MNKIDLSKGDGLFCLETGSPATDRCFDSRLCLHIGTRNQYVLSTLMKILDL